MKAKLKPSESRMLKKYIDGDAVTRIAKRAKVTERMVMYIRDGEYGDRHGIIDMLMMEAKKSRDASVNRQKFLHELSRQQRSIKN